MDQPQGLGAPAFPEAQGLGAPAFPEAQGLVQALVQGLAKGVEAQGAAAAQGKGQGLGQNLGQSQRGAALSPQMLNVGPLRLNLPTGVGPGGANASLLPSGAPRLSALANPSLLVSGGACAHWGGPPAHLSSPQEGHISALAQGWEGGASSVSPIRGAPLAGEAATLTSLPLSLSWPIPAGVGQGLGQGRGREGGSESEQMSFLTQLRALRDRLSHQGEPEASRDNNNNTNNNRGLAPAANAAPLVPPVHPTRGAPAAPSGSLIHEAAATSGPRLGMPHTDVLEPQLPSAQCPGELRLFGVRVTSSVQQVESAACSAQADTPKNATHPHIPALASAPGPRPGSRAEGAPRLGTSSTAQGALSGARSGARGSPGHVHAEDWALGAPPGLGPQSGVSPAAHKSVPGDQGTRAWGSQNDSPSVVGAGGAVEAGPPASQRPKWGGRDTAGVGAPSARLPSASPTSGSSSKSLLELLAMALRSGAVPAPAPAPAPTLAPAPAPALAPATAPSPHERVLPPLLARAGAQKSAAALSAASRPRGAALSASLALHLSQRQGQGWPRGAVAAAVGELGGSGPPAAAAAAASAKGPEGASPAWDLNQLPQDTLGHTPPQDHPGYTRGHVAGGRPEGSAGAGSKRNAPGGREAGALGASMSPPKRSRVQGTDFAVPLVLGSPRYTGQANIVSQVGAPRDARAEAGAGGAGAGSLGTLSSMLEYSRTLPGTLEYSRALSSTLVGGLGSAGAEATAGGSTVGYMRGGAGKGPSPRATPMERLVGAHFLEGERAAGSPGRVEAVSPNGTRTWIPDLNDQSEGSLKGVPGEQGGHGSAEIREVGGYTPPTELEPRLSAQGSPLTGTPPSAGEPKAPGESTAKPQRKRKRRLVPRSEWAKDLMSAAAGKNSNLGASNAHPGPKP